MEDIEVIPERLTDQCADAGSLPALAGWQPIETAPLEEMILLHPGGIGWWDIGAEDWMRFIIPLNEDRTVADDWSKRPAMLFEVSMQLLGVIPTHWMPLPPPPVQGE